MGVPFFYALEIMNKEETLHAGVCKYIALRYPHVMFNSDMSGVRLHRGLQAKVARLRSHRAMPDLMILEPHMGQGWPALFIELKAEGTRLLLKDGTLTMDKHIREQAAILSALEERGYLATFAVGFDEAKTLIDWYLTEACAKYPLPYYLANI